MSDLSLPATWRPRLVALDIDGTIVDHNSFMPATVARAIRAISASGVPVVLSTGRSWHDTKPIAEHLALPRGPVVCSNGAVTMRFPPTEVVRQITFDPTPAVARVRELAPEALVAVEELGRGYRVTEPFPPRELSGVMQVVSWEDLVSRPVTRVIVRDPERSNEEFIALADALGLHGVSYYIGWSSWLDIAPEGVHKAAALAEICREWDIDSADVLAMGDGRNDIEMLTWAGRGVALGDAPAEVQEVADHVTGRFDAGGTVSELARWFDL